MGAVLIIPIVLIVLAAASWLVWSLVAAGRGAQATARSVADDPGAETAAHSNERTNLRDVGHTAESAQDETPPPTDPLFPADPGRDQSDGR